MSATRRRPPGSVKDRFPLWGALRLIRESAYLRAIAALILIAALTTTIAGWQFKAIAKAGGARHRRAGDVLRHLQHDRGLDVAAAAAAADRPRAPHRRRRPGAVHRADGDADGIGRRADARHARRRRRVEGERSGAPLFDRQGDGGAAVSARARRPHLPGEVVHRYRRLPAGRCVGRPRRAALRRRAGLVAGPDVDGRRSSSSASG